MYSDSPNDDLGGLHAHCFRCYSSILCSHDDDACEFMQCSLKCGAVFHACKAFEHQELCPNEDVPCVNAEFGCGLVLTRRDRAMHLAQCPASVVVCMAEWNRWPLYSSEKFRSIPFRQRNPYATEGQLDFELALRDERMLNGLGRISRRTKLSLRNTLTRRFPAVPLPPESISKETFEYPATGGGLPKELLMDTGEDLTFLGIRRDKKMRQQMDQWQEDLDCRLKGAQKVPRYWEFPELEKGGIHKHCAYCYDMTCERKFDYDGSSCALVKCRWECGSVYHSCKSSEHHQVCPRYEEPGEFDWMYRGMGRTVSKKDNKKVRKLKLHEDLLTGYVSPRPVIPGGRPPPPPPMSSNIQRGCQLDIRLETVTRLQTKPRAMYTFVCAQEFRRAEYEWHCRNVHSDIHGGLNNWLEHRCPLASLGCMFSYRRMYPNSEKLTLTYGKFGESFGIKMRESPVKSKKKVAKGSKGASVLALTDLPYEILQDIATRLDSFSLYNLAITSKYLREICCSLLDSRGCVTLQWERKRINNKYCWNVAYLRWFFSTSLDPIRQWHFAPKEEISNHLQTCPFNQRVIHKGKPKGDKRWDQVSDQLKKKLKEKRNSEWFIT